jgi:dTDP-3-amino-2,3,6-trideoxy-4-keto-D-glucose/dTDP-3-amino-3,4,6-trideoxy-alpha-D-glucose/dTDP-2,6-dideoxy-D-kanosamine transaminase
MIPVFDLSRKISRFRSEIDSVTTSVLDSGFLILGAEVKEFENNFANYLGVKDCTTVANGTDALELAMRAVGVMPGSKVIATANAGHYTRTATNIIGAEVVYVDVDAKSRNLSTEILLPHLKAGAQFVVATHLYGLAIADIKEISELCNEYGVVLIEDCAQAHGAEVEGVKVGNFGAVACFSFYPTKNLGALGDGGAVVTNDSQLAKTLKYLRTYGWTDKYTISIPFGRNSRLDEMQAGYLNLFLKNLDIDNIRRREIATIYNRSATNLEILGPTFSNKDFVAHLYVITVRNRAHAIDYFQSRGIRTAIHYPIADYNQPYLRSGALSSSLPVTEELTKGVLTLPCFPELTDSEVEFVSAAIASYKA